MTTADINRIAIATPPNDVHYAFIGLAANFVAEGTVRKLLRRMARLSAIEHRYSFVNPIATADGSWLDAESIYVPGNFPATARRMQLFERFAPQLAHSAPDHLYLTEKERCGITHEIVTSCTGLYVPGLNFEVLNDLGLDPSVERTMIGFMGCHAAIQALRSAHRMVRSVSKAAVVVLNLELCSLHFQETHELEYGWSVYPGGRSILDAVENGPSQRTDALDCSRDILVRYGNISSATVMFVLPQIMVQAKAGQQGCVMSFGPGLTAETMRFHAA